ncbi:MAG: hypothetical protein ABL890_00070 [Candidatus Peribacteraceae bacterium]
MARYSLEAHLTKGLKGIEFAPSFSPFSMSERPGILTVDSNVPLVPIRPGSTAVADVLELAKKMNIGLEDSARPNRNNGLLVQLDSAIRGIRSRNAAQYGEVMTINSIVKDLSDRQERRLTVAEDSGPEALAVDENESTTVV